MTAVSKFYGLILVILLFVQLQSMNVLAATESFNLQATVENTGGILLTWTVDPTVSVYQVQRRVMGDVDWVSISYVHLSYYLGSYNDQLVQNNVTYQYRLLKGSNPEPTVGNPASEIIEITSWPLPDRSLFFNHVVTYLDTSPANSYIYMYSSGGGEFYGRAPDSTFLKSTDGITWEKRIEDWVSLTWKMLFHEGIWVSTRRDAFYYSEDNGVSWLKAVFETEGNGGESIMELFSFDGKLYASTANNNILISEDGKFWRAFENLPSVSFFHFTASEINSDKYFFVQTSNRIYRTKILGHPWKVCFEVPDGYEIHKIIGSENGLMVHIISSDSPTDTYVFPLGQDPLGSNEFDSSDVALYAFSDGKLYAYNRETYQFKSSNDGIDWTSWQSTDLGSLFNWNSLTIMNGLWVMGAWDRSIYSSTNLLNWELSFEGDSGSEYEEIILPSDSITVKRDDTLLLKTSSSFLKLTGVGFSNVEVIESQYANVINSIIWDGSRYVAVGDDGGVFTSEDAVVWAQLHEWESPYGFTELAFGNDVYITATYQYLYYSVDLIDWTLIPGNIFAPNGRELVFLGGFFFDLQGNQGPSRYSEDGINWTALSVGNCRSISYGEIEGIPLFVLVGENGVYTSNDASTWQKVDDFDTFDKIVYDGEFFIASDSRPTSTGQGGFHVSHDGTNWIWAHTSYQGNDEKKHVIVLNNELLFITDFYKLVAMTVTEDLPVGEQSEIGFHLEETNTVETQFDLWVTVFISRSGGMSGKVSVGVRSTNNGSATAGEDYAPIDQIVSWEDREFEVNFVELNIFSDTLSEGRETVEIELYDPSTGATIVGRTTTLVNIHDRPLDSWLFKYFGATSDLNAAAEGDWDNDGVLNFIEYTLGMNPMLPDNLQLAKNLEGKFSSSESEELAVIVRESLRYDDRIQINRMLSIDMQDWQTYPRLNHKTSRTIQTDLQPRFTQSDRYVSSDEEVAGIFLKYLFTYDEDGYLE